MDSSAVPYIEENGVLLGFVFVAIAGFIMGILATLICGVIF